VKLEKPGLAPGFLFDANNFCDACFARKHIPTDASVTRASITAPLNFEPTTADHSAVIACGYLLAVSTVHRLMRMTS
jgi:hypothetical protein